MSGIESPSVSKQTRFGKGSTKKAGVVGLNGDQKDPLLSFDFENLSSNGGVGGAGGSSLSMPGGESVFSSDDEDDFEGGDNRVLNKDEIDIEN
jgi:hypothetical protein